MIIRAASVNYATLVQKLENISDNQLSSCSNLKTSQFYQSEKSPAYSPFRESLRYVIYDRAPPENERHNCHNRVQIHSAIKEPS